MAEFKRLDELGLAAAKARATENRISPHAVSVRYDRQRRRIIVALETGIELGIDPALVDALSGAEDADLGDVSIEGAGSTLPFPTLDVDLTVSRLIERLLLPQARNAPR